MNVFNKLKDTAKKGIEKAADGVDKTRELVAKQNQQTKVRRRSSPLFLPLSHGDPCAANPTTVCCNRHLSPPDAMGGTRLSLVPSHLC